MSSLISKSTFSLLHKKDLYDFLKREESQNSPENIEIILGCRFLTRLSDLSVSELNSAAESLGQLGYKLFLQWDILMTEDIFAPVCVKIQEEGLLRNSLFKAIRVQDPGALWWLKEKQYRGDIHLITEQGNHNLVGLNTWLTVYPGKITRLVLSPELPYEEIKFCLKEMADKNIELELLACGPLLLFYTPRQLVSPLYGEEEDLKVMGTSEESPHKGFPIVENRHGTFMFNTKDQFILDEKDKIVDLMNLSNLMLRFDFSLLKNQAPFEECLEALKEMSEESLQNFKKSYDRPHTKGFFRVNKTDVLFKKLKNHRLQDRDQSFLGEIVDVQKKEHLGIFLKRKDGELKLGDTLRLLSPEGREKTVLVSSLKDGLQRDISSAKEGAIAFIPHVGGISVRTAVYKTLR